MPNHHESLGKGLRIAWTEVELIEGFTEARAEAAAYDILAGIRFRKITSARLIGEAIFELQLVAAV